MRFSSCNKLLPDDALVGLAGRLATPLVPYLSQQEPYENKEDDDCEPHTHNLQRLSAVEEVLSELHTDQQLGRKHAAGNPRLGPETLHMLVCDEDVKLPERRKPKAPPNHETDRDKHVLRRDRQDVLQEECRQLGQKNEQAHQRRAAHAAARREGFPLHHRPVRGRELQRSTLHLAAQGGNVCDSLPVVVAALEDAVDAGTDEDAHAVAQQDVEDHLVPPALREVGQDAREDYLGHLPRNGDETAQGNGPQHQRLAHPSDEVCKAEEVNSAHEVAEGECTVARVRRVVFGRGVGDVNLVAQPHDPLSH
eukprot:Rhum_TRINITY_DN19299_c0_g1::Rhum_TRINITY_DN19299_c0_g1_i1::g.169525::m.169525